MAEFNPSGGSQRASVLSHEQWKQVLKLCEELVELPVRRTEGLSGLGRRESGGRERSADTARRVQCAFVASCERRGVIRKVRNYGQPRPRRDGLCTLRARHRIKPQGRIEIPDAPTSQWIPTPRRNCCGRRKQTSALNHPNIVTIHEVIRSGSSIAIVMELVEGQSLRQTFAGSGCRSKRLSELDGRSREP